MKCVRNWTAALLVLVVATATACSAGQNGQYAHEASPEAVAFIERSRSAISETQWSALEDGHVTWAEYEGAILDMLTCLKASGIAAHGPFDMNDGRYLDYSYEGGPDDDAACMLEHFSFVSQVWQFQQLPSGAELARVVSEYRACLGTAGFSPPVDADLDALELFVFDLDRQGLSNESVVVCAERYSNTHFTTRLP